MNWIPIEEGLPLEPSPVIVTHEDGWVGEARYYENGDVWESGGEYTNGVLAWAPYPEPYVVPRVVRP